MTLEAQVDGLIALCCYVVVAALLYQFSRRSDSPMGRTSLLLGVMLLGLGTIHLVEAWGQPHAAGTLLKAVTAAVSLAAAVLLLPTLPRIFLLPSPRELDLARRRMEALVAERKGSEERLVRAAAFPDQNPHPFVEIDMTGRVTYANPDAKRLFPQLEAAGLAHPALRDLEPVMDAFQKGRMETSAREVDLGDRVVQQKICYVLKRNQMVVYMVDITDLRRAQEEVRLSEERFRSLYEQAPVAYHEIDSQGLIRRVNRTEEALLGFGPGELLGKPMWDLVAPEQQQQAREAVALRISGQEPAGPVRRDYLRRDGSRVTVEIHENLIRDRNGVVTGIRSTLFDITERRRAEEEIERARDAAEAANRAKSEFMANMSHEIRTPLNGIIGLTSLTLSTDVNAEQSEYLTMVHSSAESLLHVINDILDFSRIEAGKLVFDEADFSLRDTVVDALSALALRAQQKGLELAYRIKPGTPDGLVGDAGRLRQVLLNLAGNALKFTQRGEVTVKVETEKQSEGETRLRFTVADTGIGIPADKQQAIFQAFTQADASTTRKYGGTGLGLTISSRLVELMNGKIWVESEPGKGSKFHFTATLKLQPEPNPQDDPRMVGRLRGLAAVVADDNTTSRQLLGETLAAWGVAPFCVGGGDSALAACRQAGQSGEPYPLVILDADMPGLDGFAVAEQIRQNPALAATAVVMLLRTGARADVARCQSLGLRAYLAKPVRQSNLLTAVLLALGTSAAEWREPERPAEPAAGRPLRILLAEDNPVNQLVAVRLLEKRGHAVLVAETGRDALAAIERQDFDVVLMDVQMPEMDGFEATAAIRRKEKGNGRRLPIVAMTAHAMQGDRERCLEAGMDGYIAKPIAPEELLRVVESLGAGAPVSYREAPTPAPPRAVLDKELLLARVDGNVELMRSVVNLFRSEHPKMLARVARAVSDGNGKALEFAAHTLKSSLGSLAAMPAFDAALRLETMGSQGEMAEAKEVYSQLEAEIGRLEPQLLALEKELVT